MKAALVIAGLLVVVVPSISLAEGKLTAQDKKEISDAVAALKRVDPGLDVKIDATGQVVSLENIPLAAIVKKKPRGGGAGADAVRLFLEEKGDSLLQIEDAEVALAPLTDVPDPFVRDQWIVRVQHEMGGVPVFGSDAVFVVGPNQADLDLVADLTFLPDVEMSPKIDRVTALKKAIEVLDGLGAELNTPERVQALDERDSASVHVELVVFDPATFEQSGPSRLAWLVRTQQIALFLSAEDGSEIFHYDELRTACPRSTHDFNMSDSRAVLVLRNDEPPFSPPSDDALAAHAGAQAAYSYFLNTFSRPSYDARDSEIVSYVRFSELKNAYWNGTSMRYGPGYATALDVAGHEMTHAVVASSARLVYWGESGAVDEFLADFFGLMIEGTQTPENWVIGERVPGRSASEPMRSFADPHLGRFNPSKPYGVGNSGQPEVYAEKVTPAHPICKSLRNYDNGCVHLNSGILGKAAYLAAQGGRFRGRTLKGIGRDKLAAILYGTMLRLPRRSGLKDTARIAVETCESLVGVRVKAEDCTNLDGAFRAVGLR